MKKPLKKSAVTVGTALIAVLLILLIASFFGGGLHSVRDIFTPIDSLVNAGMNKLEHIYGYMYKYDALEAENAELKAQIADMQEQVRLSVSSNEENARLRKLLSLAEAHQDYSFAEASLVSWTSSGWTSCFTINRGTRAGINIGNCVVTENGFLVGRIISASGGSAVVQTILDPSSGVGASIDRTGVTAVAEGDFSLMSSEKLRLTYISDSSGTVSGDTVVTSGKGGIYPSGLIIGKVESVSLEPTGLSSGGIILPSADITSLTAVFVITDFIPED